MRKVAPGHPLADYPAFSPSGLIQGGRPTGRAMTSEDLAELKLAYRRLMSRHHPDKFAADSDPELARHATENSAAIRSAFELIRASRSDA